LNHNPVPQLPALLPGQGIFDDRAGPILLPRDHLVLWDLIVATDLQEFVGIGAALGKGVFRLVVLVDLVENIQWCNRHCPGN
jgi:hypothetical protein